MFHSEATRASSELSSLIDEELQASGKRPFQVDRLHAEMRAYIRSREPLLEEVRGVIPKVVDLCNVISETSWSMNEQDIAASATLLTALAISSRTEPELGLAAGNMLRHLCRQALQPFVLPTLTGTTTVSLLEGMFLWPRSVHDSDVASRLGRHLAQPHVLKELPPDTLATLCCYQRQAVMADRDILDAIGTFLAAPQQCSQLTLRQVSDLLATYAALGVVNEPLLAALGDRLLQRDFPDFSLVDSLTCLSAFATLRWQQKRLIGAIEQHVLQVGIKSLPLHSISKLLHAFAALDWHGIELFTAVSDHIKRQGLELSSPHDVCTLAWAFAAAPYIDDPLFMLLLRFCPTADQAGPESLARMHQFILHLRQHKDMLQMSTGFLMVHPDIGKRCQAAFEQTDCVRGGGASIAGEIQEVLRTLGFRTGQTGALPGAGGYAADAVLPCSRVAVDVDGPEKFVLCDGFRQLSGSAQLRRRHLAAYGYRVASVSPVLWEQLATLEAKQTYLQGLLPKKVDPADLLPLQVHA
eukprot:EG_transcript_4792